MEYLKESEKPMEIVCAVAVCGINTVCAVNACVVNVAPCVGNSCKVNFD